MTPTREQLTAEQAIAQIKRVLETDDGYDTAVSAIERIVAAALAPQEAAPCIGRNPLCPCQDGDSCHYRDGTATDTKAWPIPAAPMPPIEVRIAKLEDGTEEFDEVCAGACRNVHLEKMTDQMFALMIYTERETACFHIFTKNGRAHIDAREAWRETE